MPALYRADKLRGSTYYGGVTSFFAKLDNRAALELAGPDARSFLQGQTTCDIELLSQSNSVAGAYCTPQGRMVCDFRLLQRQPEQLLILLPADVVDATLATFGKYIVFSKAELRDSSDDWAQFALWGPDALAFAGFDSEAAGTCRVDGSATWTVGDIADTVELCAPATGAASLLADLEARLVGTDTADFRRHEIAHGIGHVHAPTVEMFLPQMLNYQLTGRVSFTKGCYTGQEVVARLHYRGKSKRAMLLATIPDSGEEVVATPGTPVFAEGRAQAVGNLVSSELAPEGGRCMLVVITLDALAHPVMLGENGPRLSFPPMPYSLES
jgi:folate-binding protein YgfZ